MKWALTGWRNNPQFDNEPEQVAPPVEVKKEDTISKKEAFRKARLEQHKAELAEKIKECLQL